MVAAGYDNTQTKLLEKNTDQQKVVTDATKNLQTETNLSNPNNTLLLKNNLLTKFDTAHTLLPDFTLTDNGTGHTSPQDGGPNSGVVKKDSSGRVTEVDYSNHTNRQFSYDSTGNLDKVVQPDGTVYVLKNGKWDYGPAQKRNELPSSGGGSMSDASTSSGPDFTSPQVGPDGTLTYQTKEGSFVNCFNDGTQTTVTKDLTIINQNANNQVTEINYANGSRRQFSYDKNGQISQFDDNGKTYTVKNNVIYGSDGKPTGDKNPYVSPDGTYGYTNAHGDTVALAADGTRTTDTAAGATIKQDARGDVTQINYSDGTTRQFGYDSQGHLNQITGPDGKTYRFKADGQTILGTPSGSWVGSDGKPAGFSNPQVTADGTLTYVDGKQHIVTDYASGNSSTTQKSYNELNQYAQQIHDAETNKTLLVFNSPDAQKVNQILDGLSPTDRAQLAKQYQAMYGTSLSADLTNNLGANGQHAQMLLTDANLRAEASKSISNKDDLQFLNTNIDSFERRARAQGMSDQQIQQAEQQYVKELQNKIATQGSSDAVKEIQKEMDKVAAPEMIHISTEHFNITIENDGNLTQKDYDNLKAQMEFAYNQYKNETGQDLVKETGKKYDFQFLSPDKLPWDGGGTNTSNGAYSWVTNDWVPQMTSADPAIRSQALNVMYHEIANGYSVVYEKHNGQNTNVPGWYASEGQAGFFKSHALIDGGNPSSAVTEYNQALKDYHQYLVDQAAGKKPTPEEESALAHVINESLYQKYGYAPMQYVDQQVQSGQLSFDKNASSADNNGKLLYALSKGSHANLLKFIDENHIDISPEWRQKIQGLGYPSSDVTVATSLDTGYEGPH